jgi:hypothetical protein
MLEVGSGSGPYTVCGAMIIGLQPPTFPSEVSYVERHDRRHLIGDIRDPGGAPLADTVLILVQDDNDAPMVSKAVKVGGSWMLERSFKQTLIATANSNEKGEFQFEFPYTDVDLDPGWYALKVIHGGYFEGVVRFWIARETLTQLSGICLDPATQ